MLTASSSADVIPFKDAEPRFEAWRERWVRQVLGDPEAPHAAKAITSFVSFYLNRQSRSCFLSYETIATGVAMSPRYAKENMKWLVERGHVRREWRRGKSNLLFPVIRLRGEQMITPGVNSSSPPGVNNSSPITSEVEPLTLTLRARGLPRKQRGKKERQLTSKEQAALEALRRLNGGGQ
jgi:hypothetical protein